MKLHEIVDQSENAKPDPAQSDQTSGNSLSFDKLMNQRLDRLQERLESHEDRCCCSIDELRSDLTSKVNKQEDLLDRELRKVRDDVQTVQRNKVQEIQDEMKQLRTELTEAQKVRDEIQTVQQNAVQEFQNEMTQLRSELQKVRDDVQNKQQNTVQELQNEMKQLHAELQKVRDDFQIIQQNAARELHSEMKQLRAEVMEAQLPRQTQSSDDTKVTPDLPQKQEPEEEQLAGIIKELRSTLQEGIRKQEDYHEEVSNLRDRSEELEDLINRVAREQRPLIQPSRALDDVKNRASKASPRNGVTHNGVRSFTSNRSPPRNNRRSYSRLSLDDLPAYSASEKVPDRRTSHPVPPVSDRGAPSRASQRSAQSKPSPGQPKWR